MDIDITRRHLLAGLIWPAARRASKMRFGLTTYQWGSDWDIPTLIASCVKAQALGVELRTSEKYAHGVELELSSAQRSEVKKRFQNSPVALVGLACSERFDSPDPAKLKASVENAMAYVKLSYDVGSRGLRVFPNDFQKGIPEQKTIEQIGDALNALGKYAAGYGQMIRLENHGSAGRLTTLRKIIDRVEQPSVRIMLNSDAKDNAGEGFARNFNLVQHRLADVLHMHGLTDAGFPYQLQADLLIDAGWQGWWLVEQSAKVPDRVQALIELRKAWEELVARSLKRSG